MITSQSHLHCYRCWLAKTSKTCSDIILHFWVYTSKGRPRHIIFIEINRTGIECLYNNISWCLKLSWELCFLSITYLFYFYLCKEIILTLEAINKNVEAIKKKHREEYRKSDAFRKKYKIAFLKVKDLVKLQR